MVSLACYSVNCIYKVALLAYRGSELSVNGGSDSDLSEWPVTREVPVSINFTEWHHSQLCYCRSSVHVCFLAACYYMGGFPENACCQPEYMFFKAIIDYYPGILCYFYYFSFR